MNLQERQLIISVIQSIKTQLTTVESILATGTVQQRIQKHEEQPQDNYLNEKEEAQLDRMMEAPLSDPMGEYPNVDPIPTQEQLNQPQFISPMEARRQEIANQGRKAPQEFPHAKEHGVLQPATSEFPSRSVRQDMESAMSRVMGMMEGVSSENLGQSKG